MVGGVVVLGNTKLAVGVRQQDLSHNHVVGWYVVVKTARKMITMPVHQPACQAGAMLSSKSWHVITTMPGI
jgi:hypothetical protein